jgi:PAS domain S-box-containing protein
MTETAQKLRRQIELKRAENRLQEYERVIEGSGEMIVVVDREYRYRIANRQFLHTQRLRREQVVGHFVHEFISRDFFEGVVKPKLEECFRGKVVRFEMKDGHPEGDELNLLASYFPIKGPNGIDRAACIVRDITDRRRAEQAVADMTRKLIAVQEEERARIARELHDDVAQQLALLSVELDRWSHALSGKPEIQDPLAHARQRLAEIVKDVQALSHQLHSSKLEYLGLATAAKGLCREIAEKNNVQVDFRERGSVRRKLPNQVSISLFRILQESLHNAIRHSGATQLEVQLFEQSNQMHLLVKDRGKGFDVETAKRQGGLGLISMQERARLLNGAILIHSKPNRGTTIDVRVPIESEYESKRLAA